MGRMRVVVVVVVVVVEVVVLSGRWDKNKRCPRGVSWTFECRCR